MKFLFVIMVAIMLIALAQAEPDSTRKDAGCGYRRPDCKCKKEWAPVMGDNGCGYSNPCEAKCADTRVAYVYQDPGEFIWYK